MIKEKAGEVVQEAIKAAPPISVAGLSFMGYSISEWVQLVTLLYILLQMHVLAGRNFGWYCSMCKYFKEVIRGKRKQK